MLKAARHDIMRANSNFISMNPAYPSSLVWFRRDLRCFDHAALSHALANSTRVFCVFVFDTDILDGLVDKADRRVDFIWHSIKELQQALNTMGGGLIVRHGAAREVIPQLAQEIGATAVYANRDYEPAAVMRDAAIAKTLKKIGVAFNTFKDQVIFERDEIMRGPGRPYSVFTPYKNAWLKRVTGDDLVPHPVAEYTHAFARPEAATLPTLTDLGFVATDLIQLGVKPGMSGAQATWEAFQTRLATYDETRDSPSLDATSHLGVHLRFGTLSMRELARTAHYVSGKGAQVWLSELIWREFFQMILYHHPRVMTQAFRTELDAVAWENNPERFAAWCAGRTGYPIVDAAMRQLNQTGFMHNRLRMIAASFLTKDLHLHWLQGERYFAQKLLDYDLASNNGNWQWATSTGCDAQPYFRIFDPVTQSEKLDAHGDFIKRYVPELASIDAREIHAPWRISPIEQQIYGVVMGRDYPAPVVDHEVARVKALAMFKAIKQIDLLPPETA